VQFNYPARSALSSAKSPVAVWVIVNWSEVNRLNNGAATVPRGTPAQIENILDIVDPDRMVKCLSWNLRPEH